MTTLAVTSSAAGAISDRFDALQATQITLRYPEGMAAPSVETATAVADLGGVERAGLLCRSRTGEHTVAAVSSSVAPNAGSRVGVVAAQPAALAALGVAATAGRIFDDGHGSRRDNVALIDTVVAGNLGIDGPAGQVVYLADREVSVIGIFEAPPGQISLTGAVVVPYERCLDETAVPDQREESVFQSPELAIRTKLGAADQVAQEAPLAASPTEPEALFVTVPPDLSNFRQGVESDTRALFLGLALISLIIGSLGVSNTTLVSVMERRSEIGLRRAVGASRRAIGAQFLIESGALGLAGGALGFVLAVNITAIVTVAKGWTLVFEPWLVAAGPALGLVVGVLAGAYPAWTASRVAPASTLRS